MNKYLIIKDLPKLQRIRLNRFAMTANGNETRRSREVPPYNCKNVLIIKGILIIGWIHRI